LKIESSIIFLSPVWLYLKREVVIACAFAVGVVVSGDDLSGKFLGRFFVGFAIFALPFPFVGVGI
jgi:hypothetical protein